MKPEEFKQIPDDGNQTRFPLFKITTETPDRLENAGYEINNQIRELTGYAIALDMWSGHAQILLPTTSTARVEAITKHLQDSGVLQNGIVSVEIVAA